VHGNDLSPEDTRKSRRTPALRGKDFSHDGGERKRKQESSITSSHFPHKRPGKELSPTSMLWHINSEKRKEKLERERNRKVSQPITSSEK